MSAIADPRIEVRVSEVRRKVDEDIAQSDEHHATLNQRKVALQDARHEQRAEPWPREDGLDQDGAGEQIAGLDTDQRRDADERIRHDMADHEPPLREALSARCAHVIET